MKSVSQIKIVCPLAALFLAMAWVAADFKTPNANEREEAVGSLVGLEKSLQQSFTAGEHFEPKREPGGRDWLAMHEEPGQTFRQYLESDPNHPGEGGRSVLYVLPLGDFPEEAAPDLGILREYMELYYAPMSVKVLTAVPKDKVQAVVRTNSLTGNEQWNSVEMLKWLRRKLPRDAYGLIAITMTDLYPGEGWNFVFGQASYKSRVGVFSFARYHPSLNFEDVKAEDEDQIGLRRASKVLTHEMGHMFGIKHCIHYECNMNGANSLRECDVSPMHLCPVCLRKLQRAVGFDPVSRYRELEQFYREKNFAEEANWVQQRLAWIQEESS
jgi:archaemetzincin